MGVGGSDPTEVTTVKTSSRANAAQLSTSALVHSSLSDGGKGRFKREVKAKVNLLLAQASPSQANPTKKMVVMPQKQRILLQATIEWQNGNQYITDMGAQSSRLSLS